MIIVTIIILINWPVSPHLKVVRMRIIMIVIILVMMTVLARLAPSESEDGEVMMMLVKILKMMVVVARMVIKILNDNFGHRGLFAERK